MEWLTWAVIAVFVGWVFFQTVRVVPQREVFVVERLGKFYKSLEAGFHILIPFIDKVSYKHTLKEQTIDVPSQSCITADNIAVEIDGICTYRFRMLRLRAMVFRITDTLLHSLRKRHCVQRSVESNSIERSKSGTQSMRRSCRPSIKRRIHGA